MTQTCLDTKKRSIEFDSAKIEIYFIDFQPSPDYLQKHIARYVKGVCL